MLSGIGQVKPLGYRAHAGLTWAASWLDLGLLLQPDW